MARATLAALVVWGAASLSACGEERPPVVPGPVPGPAAPVKRSEIWQKVAEIRALPKQDQMKRLLELADSVPPMLYESDERTFEGLAKAVVEMQELEWADELDLRLPESSWGRQKRTWMYHALFGVRADPRALRLLQRLAKRHPEVISLAGFRPGGMEFLLGVLESPDAEPMERRLAARELGVHGTKEVVPRLEAMADDATRVDDGVDFSQNEDYEPAPLGSYVRQAIEIRTR